MKDNLVLEKEFFLSVFKKIFSFWLCLLVVVVFYLSLQLEEKYVKRQNNEKIKQVVLLGFFIQFSLIAKLFYQNDIFAFLSRKFELEISLVFFYIQVILLDTRNCLFFAIFKDIANYFLKLCAFPFFFHYFAAECFMFVFFRFVYLLLKSFYPLETKTTQHCCIVSLCYLFFQKYFLKTSCFFAIYGSGIWFSKKGIILYLMKNTFYNFTINLFSLLILKEWLRYIENTKNNYK